MSSLLRDADIYYEQKELIPSDEGSNREEEEKHRGLSEVSAVLSEEENEEGGNENPNLNGHLNRANFLSSAEIRHLNTAFDVCDVNKDGCLQLPEFMNCLSIMGKRLSMVEAQAYFNQIIGESDYDDITRDDWIHFYANFMQLDVDEKELYESFMGLWKEPTANFPGTGEIHEGEEFIPHEKLYEIMTKYGDKLTAEEAVDMIRECHPDENGRIFFENYRSMLIETRR